MLSFSSVIRKFSKRNVFRYFSVAVVYEVVFFFFLLSLITVD
jgi:presenilin-like A22 family membrane protease